jgi:hypothetical protein
VVGLRENGTRGGTGDLKGGSRVLSNSGKKDVSGKEGHNGRQWAEASLSQTSPTTRNPDKGAKEGTFGMIKTKLNREKPLPVIFSQWQPRPQLLTKQAMRGVGLKKSLVKSTLP